MSNDGLAHELASESMVEAIDAEPDLDPANSPTSDAEPDPEVAPAPDWWHRDHPVFTAITGFFTGMLLVTAVPGAFASMLRLLLPYQEAERYFPFVALGLVVPAALLINRRTRRFGIYMAIGMVLTALVVLGVASLVLYFMVRIDG